MPVIDLTIQQLLLDGAVVRARSSNVPDEHEQALIDLHGRWRHPGDEEALFARPLGKMHVIIGRGRHGRLHLLIMGRELYNLLHDPFAIADRYPVNYDARGSLPDLDWPPEPLPPRTVGALNVMTREGDGPFLFGAAQTLVDGSKVILVRPVPEPRMVRETWALLPDSVRRILNPATFAPDNDLEFDFAVLPVPPAASAPGVLSEDQVREYPECRYERELQLAIETGDQRLLEQKLARKTTSDMIRLALIIIVVMIGLAIGVQIFGLAIK